MLFITFLVPCTYMFFSYLDYSFNPISYQQNQTLPRAWKTLIWNLWFWYPLSLLILQYYVPIHSNFHSWTKELLSMAIEVVWGEIWFYTCHRLCHTKMGYAIHKKHHEIREPIGILALYAHPIELIVVNSGSVYITHCIFQHSLFHIIITIVGGLMNTILYSHSSQTQKEHYMHHKYHNVEFGWSLFMDQLFGTQCKGFKSEKGKLR